VIGGDGSNSENPGSDGHVLLDNTVGDQPSETVRREPSPGLCIRTKIKGGKEWENGPLNVL